MVICGEVIISRAQYPPIICQFILQHTWQSTVAGLLETLDWSFLWFSVRSGSKLTLHVISGASEETHFLEIPPIHFQLTKKWLNDRDQTEVALTQLGLNYCRGQDHFLPSGKVPPRRQKPWADSWEEARETGRNIGEEALTVWFCCDCIWNWTIH